LELRRVSGGQLKPKKKKKLKEAARERCRYFYIIFLTCFETHRTLLSTGTSKKFSKLFSFCETTR
jgi:hypothetical protein